MENLNHRKQHYFTYILHIYLM